MRETVSEIADVFVTNADVLLDNITESKIFDSFPIISDAVALLKIAQNITNALYAKKLSAFVKGLKSNNIDCDTFSKGLKLHSKNRKHFETTILFLIEKAQDDEKAQLLGYFTGLFILSVFSYDEYIFFVNIINTLQFQFLKSFSKSYSLHIDIQDSDLYAVFASQGLVQSVGMQMAIDDKPIIYKMELTEKAKKLGKYLNEYFSLIV